LETSNIQNAVRRWWWWRRWKWRWRRVPETAAGNLMRRVGEAAARSSSAPRAPIFVSTNESKNNDDEKKEKEIERINK